MPVNLDKPHLWKADGLLSVDMYNAWFMKFAPQAFRSTRVKTTKDVETALAATGNLTNIQPAMLRRHPEFLPTLRMSTCPPLAVDRLIGLADVSPSMVKRMEDHRMLPVRMSAAEVDVELGKIGAIIEKMADPDIFVWLDRAEPATALETNRAATIIADRLCGAVANPIVPNAQEKRQLCEIKTWLEARGYRHLPGGVATQFETMPPGTFCFRLNVRVEQITENKDATKSVNIPIDAVIMPKSSKPGDFPLFFEAKSAGDFANTNKRRKEEATKMIQMKSTYNGKGHVRFNLFLCGYFNAGYLGYAAADGIDWVWEHRIDDLALFGL